MALNHAELKNRIIQEMEALGASASGQHSWVERMSEAIAKAVVDEIRSNAQVLITGGSSAGNYKVL